MHLVPKPRSSINNQILCMKRLTRNELRGLMGGKFAPGPCSVCNNASETPYTNQVSTYYHADSSGNCNQGGSLVDNSKVVCVFYTTQYTCSSSGLNPQFGPICYDQPLT
jgi:hypothetical protein